jgi:acyl-coenzyme A thioesterase PaaI-like protein
MRLSFCCNIDVYRYIRIVDVIAIPETHMSQGKVTDAPDWKEIRHGALADVLPTVRGQRTQTGWRYATTFQDRHENGLGRVHGGMLMAFADQMIGRFAWEAADRAPCATIELTSTFLSAARVDEMLVLEVRLLRPPARLLFLSAEITADERVVARFGGIWSILRQ